jgi:hypothetical protein
MLDSSSFKDSVSEKAASSGSIFDSRRWFSDDAQLMHLDGKTYAFSSQWGGENWYRAMNLIKEKYPAFKIDFVECVRSS